MIRSLTPVSIRVHPCLFISYTVSIRVYSRFTVHPCLEYSTSLGQPRAETDRFPAGLSEVIGKARGLCPWVSQGG